SVRSAFTNIVAVPTSVPDCIRRRHSRTTGAMQQTDERRRLRVVTATLLLTACHLQFVVHPCPELAINNGFVLAGIDLSLMNDRAGVEDIAEQRPEGHLVSSLDRRLQRSSVARGIDKKVE